MRREEFGSAAVAGYTLQELKTFIFQELVYVDNPDQFGDNDDLLEAGLDSMGIMRLVLFVEEQFGVVLPDDEIEPDNLRSLRLIQNWVDRHKQS